MSANGYSPTSTLVLSRLHWDGELRERSTTLEVALRKQTSKLSVKFSGCSANPNHSFNSLKIGRGTTGAIPSIVRKSAANGTGGRKSIFPTGSRRQSTGIGHIRTGSAIS